MQLPKRLPLTGIGELLRGLSGPSRRGASRARGSTPNRPKLIGGATSVRGHEQRAPWVGCYPDLAVYCTDEVHPLDADTRIHPTLLVEVTSKTTENKDRIAE